MLTGLAPTIQYIFERINAVGDCLVVMDFFRGAKIFDPFFVKTLSHQEVFKLIDKMSYYPVFREGGQNSTIVWLKKHDQPIRRI